MLTDDGFPISALQYPEFAPITYRCSRKRVLNILQQSHLSANRGFFNNNRTRSLPLKVSNSFNFFVRDTCIIIGNLVFSCYCNTVSGLFKFLSLQFRLLLVLPVLDDAVVCLIDNISIEADVILTFGGDISALPNGVFDDAASEKIFEDKNKGTLA